MRRLALEAGARILEVYTRPDIEVNAKSDQSPVTEADEAADALISAGLRKAFPMLPLVTEEQAATHAHAGATFLIVDPLDGTKEFVQRRGDFTVNIAFVEDGVPMRGVVYAPAQGRMFYTRRDRVVGGGNRGTREDVAEHTAAHRCRHARQPRLGGGVEVAPRLRRPTTTSRDMPRATSAARGPASSSVSSRQARPISTRGLAARWNGTRRQGRRCCAARAERWCVSTTTTARLRQAGLGQSLLHRLCPGREARPAPGLTRGVSAGQYRGSEPRQATRAGPLPHRAAAGALPARRNRRRRLRGGAHGCRDDTATCRGSVSSPTARPASGRRATTVSLLPVARSSPSSTMTRCPSRCGLTISCRG